jgi:hypothetical protein
MRNAAAVVCLRHYSDIYLKRLQKQPSWQTDERQYHGQYFNFRLPEYEVRRSDENFLTNTEYSEHYWGKPNDWKCLENFALKINGDGKRGDKDIPLKLQKVEVPRISR